MIYFKGLVFGIEFANSVYFWFKFFKTFINIISDMSAPRSKKPMQRDKMASSALEATLRGITSPVREQRPKPAEERTKKRPAAALFSYYKERQETGAEPPFRKRKRTPAELANDNYVKGLKSKIEREGDKTDKERAEKERYEKDKLFVQSVAEKLEVKIEDEDTKRMEIIKRLNEEATIPPDIEFDIQ